LSLTRDQYSPSYPSTCKKRQLEIPRSEQPSIDPFLALWPLDIAEMLGRVDHCVAEVEEDLRAFPSPFTART
jgi:hypothetical protein